MGHATILGALAVVAFATAGCVVHPDGEREERDRASAAGVAYARPFAERELPELPPDAPLATFVARAEAANGGLEAAWQRWRAALERVPQDGSQPTTAMVGLQHTLDGGAALDRTVLSVLSDAMRNLLWPGRVAAQAEAALADARTVGAEFTATRLALQTAVAEAWLALAERDADLAIVERMLAQLDVQVPATRALLQAGRGRQGELLGVTTAVTRLRIERDRLADERPALVAALRALLGGVADAFAPRPELPALAPLREPEQALLAAAVTDGPALAVRRNTTAAAARRVDVARWLRVPEFSLAALVRGSVDQTLGLGVSLPWLRQPAIDAGIREAEAQAAAADALQRQAGEDLIAAVQRERALLLAIERQHRALAEDLLPLLAQTAAAERAAWSAGRADLAAWTSAELARLEVERSLVGLRAAHALGRARLQELVGPTTFAP